MQPQDYILEQANFGLFEHLPEADSPRENLVEIGNENLIIAALTKHAQDRSKIALVWESANGRREVFSFFDLERQSNRLANALQTLGVKPGTRVFTVLERTPELYVAIAAGLKLNAAVGVLFAEFGSEAIRQRLGDAGAKVVIVNHKHAHKIAEISQALPDLTDAVILGETETPLDWREDLRRHDFDNLITQADADFEVVETAADDNCFLIYTSGTTGLPKGAVHRHAIQDRLRATANRILQLDATDFYWCAADPGWVTGLFYGVFAPWLLGLPFLVYEGEFDAIKWLDLLERNQVTCWYVTPTMLRKLRNEAGDDLSHRRFALRRIYSVGEPLNTQLIAWVRVVFRVEVYDNYWQTETGTHVIANRPGIAVKPGSMGPAVNGVHVAIVDETGRELPDGTTGDIAIRPTLGSLFKGYWNFPEATQACFRAGWYITKDRGWRDGDGYFWFVARNDDVITCEAQRVGPFEVENALVSHPAVAEAAVIGVRDALRTQHVKAFVVLHQNYEPARELAEQIAAHVRAQLSPFAAPREIEFRADLPKTQSGKTQRDKLRGATADNEKNYSISEE